jgi:adenosine/AMP kinase
MSAAFEIVMEEIENPEGLNFILGHSHFIKTVEDLYEVMAGGVPGAKFGIAFCEASGDCLVRLEGNDRDLVELAKKNALALGAGHSFIIFMRDCYPINVLNAVKDLQEVCNIHCATANSVQVILAQSAQGRGILGVIDGVSPKGTEGPGEVAERTALLRKFGYKRG